MKTDKEFSFLVRHNAHNAVMATVERLAPEPGFRLLSVAPRDGKMPSMEHLLGVDYPDLGCVKRVLVSAMKDCGDTLDNVNLSLQAYQAWMEVANRACRQAVSLGVDASSIPDEMAKALPDGHLLIWVDVPGMGRVEMRVPKGGWAWRKQPN